jgi:hypothetical protein
VIFAPIVQVGCFNACSLVTVSSFSFGRKVASLNGPPEQVNQIFFTSSRFQALRHCHIAECSESIGLISPPYFFSNSFISCQATTIVSLFASATIFHFWSADLVGKTQIFQTTEFTSISVFSSSLTATNHSIQIKISTFIQFNFDCNSVFFSALNITTFFGKNSLI